MKTKIIYTLVGDVNDVYLPQAMIAIYSARIHNQGATIILVVDYNTSCVINETLPKIKDYINEILVVNTPGNMSNKEKSRYIKTTLRQHIKGDYLFIDTDTIITESLESIDLVEANIAAVLDRHILVENHQYKNKICAELQLLGMNLEDLQGQYFNSGVMYVKDTDLAHEFYKKWYSNWEYSRKLGKCIDQPSMALANKQCNYPIFELEGFWNCQLADNFLNFLHDAKILHYFASNNSSPYRLYDKRIFIDILTNKSIPPYLKNQLQHPKDFFVTKHSLAYGKDVTFLNSNLHKIFLWHKNIFDFFEFLSRVLISKKIC